MFSAHVHELYGSVEHHTWLPTSSSVWGLPKKVLVVLSNLLVTGSIDVNWIRYLNSLWIHVKHPPKINTCLQAHGGFPQPQPPPPLHAAFKTNGSWEPLTFSLQASIEWTRNLLFRFAETKISNLTQKQLSQDTKPQSWRRAIWGVPMPWNTCTIGLNDPKTVNIRKGVVLLLGGGFNQIKIMRQNGNLPQVGVKIKKYLSCHLVFLLFEEGELELFVGWWSGRNKWTTSSQMHGRFQLSLPPTASKKHISNI